MKKRIASLALAAMLSVSMLAGCAAEPKSATAPDPVSTQSTAATQAEPSTEPTTEPAEKIKVGMVTDEGGLNDRSFNEIAWEGLTKAKEELGITAINIESHKPEDYPGNLETMLEQDNDLIWGIGYNMASSVEQAAKNNTEQKYGIVDAAYEQVPPNVACALFREEEVSYLVGMIAGKMTKTNKIGFVGGRVSEVIGRFEYGFKAGVKAANASAQVDSRYADSFTDVAKGKGIASSMYAEGADIVFHAAGGVGNGVIEAAKEQNKMVIGVDKDQNFLAPDNVITSAVKRVDVAMMQIVKETQEGNFPGGKVRVFGLAENGVDIAPTSDKHVPKEILDEVQAAKEKIVSGEIKVPATEAEFNAASK